MATIKRIPPLRTELREAGVIRLTELLEQSKRSELSIRQELADLERQGDMSRFVVGNYVMLRWAGPKSPDDS